MSAYLLAKHVYLCATPQAAVLLDLKADRYYGMNGEQSRALSRLVYGWPDAGEVAQGGAASAEEVAQDFLKSGLLTRDATAGKPAFPPALPTVAARLYEWDSAQLPTISVLSVMRMCVACARATYLLKLRSLEKAVTSVWRRKARHAAPGQTEDLTRIRAATLTYRALRPFFYTVKDRCLYDSLVLVEFLALYDLFPTWVIGVRTTPFGAHSWVQVGHYVLNSPVDAALTYNPILAV